MAHTTELVSYKKLSNGQFSVCIRCCGEPSTDSWHTLATGMSKEDRQKSIDEAHKRVAAEHQGAQDAEAQAVELMGQQQEHG